MLKSFGSILLKTVNSNSIVSRGVSRKRFFKSSNVIYGKGKYEVTLDQRKLRTPKGNILALESEPLALAVAAEWNAQKTTINHSNMHLTGLCFTAIDNPDDLTEQKLAEELTSYLENDTILYHTVGEGQEELYEMELEQWVPVSDWLCSRYHIDVQPTQLITGPVISEEDKNKIRQYFLSYNMWALLGFRFSIEALKSVILGLAVNDRFLSVAKATSLSRLEEDYQCKKWGKVEWAHDLAEQSTRARVAAGTLLIQANSSAYLVKTKRSTG